MLLLWPTGKVFATHNRAGEITYEQIGDLTIRMTLTTYTRTSSSMADRDSLEIQWGDGSSQWVRRVNGSGTVLPNDTKRNLYIAEHTYPGRATYTISMTDPNRNAGIINVNPPNSINVMFHIETTFTFLNPQFQGYNSSPVLLQPPIDIGCVGQLFVHNPNAYDADGDSLAYELIVPRQDRDLPVPNYLFPNQINPGPANLTNLNTTTGDFVWLTPQQAGEYNIAILIKEYRAGVLINTIIRDMQILILNCENRPPEIASIDEICVIAGDTVVFDVTATDPDRNPTQKVRLQAFGGPFAVAVNPATLQVAQGFQDHPLTGRFIWVTDCDHISDKYYNVIFKAEDNFFDTVGLSTLKTVRIKVSGPPPEGETIEVGTQEVLLGWDSPYPCEDASMDYFRGFSIWRKNSSNSFQPDTCMPSMAGKGYTRIASRVKTQESGRYIFRDNDIEKGRTYCYRIVPEFARLSSAGNPYNLVEGLPSDELCVALSRDVPIITRASVLETAPDGRIEVKWSKPLVPDLDTLTYPGPYTYRLLRGEGFDPAGFSPVPGATFTTDYFSEANDTVFVDQTGVHTIQSPYAYMVEFLTGNTLYGQTNPASTVFLSVVSTDRRNELSWDFSVPWENTRYEVYRRTETETDFSLLAETAETAYIDRNLDNGSEYCYYIRSIGTYGISQIEDPLFNLSQQLCGIPIDSVPPCSPDLTVTNDCSLAGDAVTEDLLFNLLRWNDPAVSCPDSRDVALYHIYFSTSRTGPFERVATIDNPRVTDLTHKGDLGLAGCYYITAVDSIGNESPPSDTVCVDNCPRYILPNTFTPNGDGYNDLFRPRLKRFIAFVDFKVYNRWGNLVFETSDPDLNWSGANSNGTELADGTYHYICRVFEQKLDGNLPVETSLSGFIELIR